MEFLSDGIAYSTNKVIRMLGIDKRVAMDILKDLYYKGWVSFFDRYEQFGSADVPTRVRYWFRPDKAIERAKEEIKLMEQARKREEITPAKRVVGKRGSGGTVMFDEDDKMTIIEKPERKNKGDD